MHRTIGWIAFLFFAALPGHGLEAAPAVPAVSPAEYAGAAEQSLARMESGGKSIRTQLQRARAQRDVVKTLCLNDKLNQMDVTIRSARERKQELEAALGRADEERAGHEFTILTVLRQRGDQLTAEANQCVGIPEPPDQGKDIVRPDIDDNIVDDPTEYPADSVIIEPPACSSCVK